MMEPGRPTPSNAAERWAEIVEASHDGMALVDPRWRIAFVSEPFAAAFGSDVTALTGTDLAVLLPGITAPRSAIAETLGSGTTVRLEVQRRSVDAETRFLRLMLVPRPDGTDGGRGVIAVVHDVTDLRRAQLDRRRAQQRLTAVEEELRRRIERDIHDGPIQILAALTLRVASAPATRLHPDVAGRLSRSISDASAELRHLLAELTHSERETAGEQLERWAAPLLAGTPVDLSVTDRLRTRLDRSTIETLFVFVHEVIAACVVDGNPRRIDVELEDANDGHRLAIAISSDVGSRYSDVLLESQISAAAAYARAKGGSLEVTWQDPADGDDRHVQVAESWLPRLDASSVEIAVATPTRRLDRPESDTEPPTGVSPLDDADWRALAAASHEGLLEIDADLTVTFVNESYATAMQRPAADMLGLPFDHLFAPGDYERLGPYVRKVQAGEAIRFDWQRRNAVGQQRWTQVSASPRSDASGAFAGALLATLDTTDFHQTIDLAQAVYDQIEQTRRRVSHDIALRLQDGPLELLEAVSSQLRALSEADDADTPVRAIHAELDRSIAALRDSLGQLAEPDVASQEWSRALGDSVASLIASTPIELTISDEVSSPISLQHASTIVRVAREAIANAVLHGRAGRVDVTLGDHDDVFELRIVDDGIGVTTDDLRPRPGHLGIRSMRERVAEHQGSLTIEPDEHRGTIVVAVLPKSPGILAPSRSGSDPE